MHNAVPKEGPCAPLFCLGLALLLAAGGTAIAQTVEQSDLERCANLKTVELKLACFEALAAIERTESEPAVEVAPDPLPESAAAQKRQVTTGAAIIVVESDAESAVPAPTAAANDGKTGVVNETVADETREDELGREQLEHKKVVEKEEVLVRAIVSKVVKGSHDVLYFHFANGQVWRQAESRRFSYPRNKEFDVIIKVGMMGDYRLRLETGGPMTQIRRVQ